MCCPCLRPNRAADRQSIHVHTYIYECMHACVYACVYACMHLAAACTHICMRVRACVYACEHASVRACTHERAPFQVRERGTSVNTGKHKRSCLPNEPCLLFHDDVVYVQAPLGATDTRCMSKNPWFISRRRGVETHSVCKSAAPRSARGTKRASKETRIQGSGLRVQGLAISTIRV